MKKRLFVLFSLGLSSLSLFGMQRNFQTFFRYLQVRDTHKALELLNSKPEIAKFVDSKNSDFTALHFAAQSDSEQLVNRLIRLGARVNAEMADGSTPLHRAAGNGNRKITQKLVAAGADLNAVDRIGETPLALAASMNKLNVIELLVTKININIGDFSKRTPLYIATLKGYTDIVTLLLKMGADAVAGDQNGFTSLHVAAEKNDCDMLQILLNGRDLNILTSKGFTPLYVAALYGCLEAVKLLLSRGPLIDAVSESGHTPLLAGVMAGHVEIVRLLITAGANVNHTLGKTISSLLCAVKDNQLEMVRLILKSGQKIKDLDDALELAKFKKFNDIVIVLEEFIENLTSTNTNIEMPQSNQKRLVLFNHIDEGYDASITHLSPDDLMTETSQFVNVCDISSSNIDSNPELSVKAIGKYGQD